MKNYEHNGLKVTESIMLIVDLDKFACCIQQLTEKSKLSYPLFDFALESKQMYLCSHWT